MPDVRTQIGVSKSQAYRMLAEAVGREEGARGTSSCPLRLWNAYLEEREKCGATNRGSTRSGGSGAPGSTWVAVASSAPPASGRALQLVSSPPSSKRQLRIPPTQPRKRRP